jgi:hypothetical protein
MDNHEVMYCSKCGQKNNENNYKCTQCGSLLHSPPPAHVVVTDEGTLGGLIPKNAKALWAYYLGIFSFIPLIGLPMGAAAFILGIKGLQFARDNPEAKGKIHAWIGIVLGGFFALIYTFLVIAMLNASQN